MVAATHIHTTQTKHKLVAIDFHNSQHKSRWSITFISASKKATILTLSYFYYIAKNVLCDSVHKHKFVPTRLSRVIVVTKSWTVRTSAVTFHKRYINATHMFLYHQITLCNSVSISYCI